MLNTHFFIYTKNKNGGAFMKAFDLDYVIDKLYRDRRIYAYSILDVIDILILVEDVLKEDE